MCLSLDDLEALQVLYPDCEQAFSVPVCSKFAHNIGWVRLGVYVGIPLLLSLLLLMLLNACVRQHHVARLKSAKNLLGLTEAELGEQRMLTSRACSEADALQRDLREQRELEDIRVEERARELSVVILEARRAGNGARSSSPESAGRSGRRGSGLAAGLSPGRSPGRRLSLMVDSAITWVSGRFTRPSRDASPRFARPPCNAAQRAARQPSPGRELKAGEPGPMPRSIASPSPARGRHSY